MTRIWNTWLPTQLADEISRDEPLRFAAVVQGLQRDYSQATASSDANRWHSVVRWVPLINNFLQTKVLYPLEDIHLLVDTLMAVVLASTSDLEVQVRCAGTLADVLRTFKRDITCEVAWRPLYDLVQSLCGNSAPRLEGVGLTTARHTTLFKLVAASRRFFPPSAAGEVWSLLRPALLDTGPHNNALAGSTAAYEALGWMLLFFPTHVICKCDIEHVNTWVAEWLVCWDQLQQSRHWNQMWMSLFARAAKHDWTGFIVWLPHIPRLLTYINWSFEVPVGTAMASVPVHRSPPYKAVMLFMGQASHESSSAALLLVHLVKACPERPATLASAAAAMAGLEAFMNLLEQYYHPSNYGRWCRDLSSSLKNLTHAFMKQLGRQGPAPQPWQAAITPDIQDRLVAVLIMAASRAQFSKDDSLSQAACKALCSLAYVRPQQVLPLVVNRFRLALASATAPHQLSAAVSTLAMCVRPMLLAGWSSPEEDTPQLITEAIMAALPGIDANDEAKTSAVFHFYTAVLSSLPSLDFEAGGSGLVLPLYVEEWGEEVVQRITTLLQNLDLGPAQRADQAASTRNDHMGASFLLHGNTMFCPFLEMLFERLPASVTELLVRRIATFVTTSTLPGVTSEAATLLNAAAGAPGGGELVRRLVVEPLLRTIRQELVEAQGAHSQHVSQSVEQQLRWQLTLVREAIFVLGGEHVMLVMQDVEAVAEDALAVPSKAVQLQGAAVLGSALMALCKFGLPLSGQSKVPLLPQGVECWVEKEGQGFTAPQWRQPTPDQLQLAQDVTNRYLTAACADLRALVGGAEVATAASASSHGFKMRLHASLARLRGVLTGSLSCLREYDFPNRGSGMPVCVLGAAGMVVGDPGVREMVTETLVVACRSLAHEPESLASVMTLAGLVLCNGLLEYGASGALQRDLRRASDMIAEPSLAGMYQGDESCVWRKRLPYSLVLDRLRHQLVWRASQAAFRSYSTQDRPELTDVSQLPPSYVQLVQWSCVMSMHPFKQVRDEALPVVENCLKRFGFLSASLLPHYFSALADLPALPADSPPPPVLELLTQLQAAAAATPPVEGSGNGGGFPGSGSGTNLVSLATGAALGGATAQESERDGRVLGASRVMQMCLPFWRHIFRHPSLFSCMLTALMGSRRYSSSQAQAAISQLLMNMSGRFMHPPALDLSSPLYLDLCRLFLSLGAPSALRQHWRYSLTANIFLLLTMPPMSHGADDVAVQRLAATFTTHFLVLLDDDMLVLRQLAGAGLYFQLAAVLKYGAPGGAVLEALRAAIGTDNWGHKLIRRLTGGHTALDAAELNKDKRSGGGIAALQQQLMSMTFEEIITKVVQASVDRYHRWPDGEDKPAAMKDGLFEVGHARFVASLAAAAPCQVVVAFKEPLQQLMTDKVLGGSLGGSGGDKAEHVTCAEVCAGLLGSGAPWREGADGSWVVAALEGGLHACHLELADCWSLALRYGVRGLLELSGLMTKEEGLSPAASSHTVIDAATAESALCGLLDMVLALPGSNLEGGSGALGVISGPAGVASGLVAQTKYLKYLRAAVAELRYCGPIASLPPRVRSFWSSVLAAGSQLLRVESLGLREEGGALLSDVLSYWEFPARVDSNGGGSGSSGGAVVEGGEDVEMVSRESGISTPLEVEASDDPSAVVLLHTSPAHLCGQAHKLAAQLLACFSAAASQVQNLRAETASTPSALPSPTPPTTAALDALSSATAPAPPPATPSTTSSASPSKDSDIVMVDRPPSPVTSEDASTSLTNGNGGSAGGAAEDSVGLAVAQIGYSLQFIKSVVMRGELSRLTGVLVGCLGPLLRLQELAGPVLVKMSRESKMALVLMKCVSLQAPQVARAVDAVLCAAVDPLWSCRAAALVLSQNLWFRHCQLMDPQHLNNLLECVVAGLSDTKAEVRQAAVATLSGLIKGLAPAAQAALRRRLLDRAKAIFGRRTTRPVKPVSGLPALPQPPSSAAADLAVKQGTLGGLKALVMSSPYDCPEWMDAVLMALVAAAGDSTAVLRSEVSKVVSEFKRTHEQDSLDELRSRLDADQWDALQQVGNQSTYFT